MTRRRGLLLLISAATSILGGCGAQPSSPRALQAKARETTGAVTFRGSFAGESLAAWTGSGGGINCGNDTSAWHGAPGLAPDLEGGVYWGNLYIVPGPGLGASAYVARIDLTDQWSPATPPRRFREACHVSTPSRPLFPLSADSYIGTTVYVPPDWSSGDRFPGVNIGEYHFVLGAPRYYPGGLDGAPITLQLHPGASGVGAHVTLALETGTCIPVSRPDPICSFVSDADSPSARCPSRAARTYEPGVTYTCIPPAYAVPPGAFPVGRWVEIITHVHWATDGSGQVQTWYRVAGEGSGRGGWIPSASIVDIPTVQTLRDPPAGCCDYLWRDFEPEAYTFTSNVPRRGRVSVEEGGEVVGSGFGAVAEQMP